MLANLIHEHAATAAAAGDWPAVAAALNAATVQKTSAGSETSLSTVLIALGSAAAELTLAALDLSEIGKSGRAKLEARGLDFAHPLTVGLIMQLDAAGALPAGVAVKLLSLGRWTVSPAADAGLGTVTADQCQQAVESAAAALALQAIGARITNATALARERMTLAQSDAERIEVWATAWVEGV